MKIILGFLIISGIVPGVEKSYAGQHVDSVYFYKEVRYIDSLNRSMDPERGSHVDTNRTVPQEALDRAVSIHYLKGQIDALKGLASYYSAAGNISKAFEFIFSRLELHLKNNYLPGYVKTHIELSSLFLKLNDTAKAMKYIRLGYKIAQKTCDPEDFGLIYYALGNYFFTKGEYLQAKRNGLLSIACFIKSKNNDWQGMSYRMIGDACQKLGQYAEAIGYYNHALKKVSQPGSENFTEMGTIYTRIAHVYKLLNDLPKVRDYNLLALHYREYAGIMDMTGQSMINLARVYSSMNMRDSFIYYLKTGIKVLEPMKNFSFTSAAYHQLYEYYLQEKDYKNAFIALQKYDEFNHRLSIDINKSEINILNTNWLITEMEYNNEVLKQENTLKKIQLRNRRIETVSFEAGFLVIFFFTLFGINLLFNARKKRMKLGLLNEQLKTEILVNTENEILLRQSEERYRFLAENLVDMISLLDGNMNRIYVSPSCKKLFGFETHEMLTKKPEDLVAPFEYDIIKQRLDELKLHGKSIRYTFKALRKDGTTFWAETIANPVFNSDTGEVKEIISVIRDISDRKNHEEFISENERQKEVLLHEIHNRVKNNFAILISLMDMQRSLSHDPVLDRSFTDLQLRVRTMSLVHEQLYIGRGIHVIPFDDYLKNLSQIVSSTFKTDLVTLHNDIDPCTLTIEMALPLGLIVNELITNAYKYAFSGKDSGNVWVLLKPKAEERWSITIRDDGIGLPSDFSSRTAQSMGSQIIRLLVQQVEGNLEISNRDGACFNIDFPVKNC